MAPLGLEIIRGVGKSFDQFDYSSFVDAPLCSYLVACCFPKIMMTQGADANVAVKHVGKNS